MNKTYKIRYTAKTQKAVVAFSNDGVNFKREGVYTMTAAHLQDWVASVRSSGHTVHVVVC